jgi:hypothetical protein
MDRGFGLVSDIVFSDGVTERTNVLAAFLRVFHNHAFTNARTVYGIAPTILFIGHDEEFTGSARHR